MLKFRSEIPHLSRSLSFCKLSPAAQNLIWVPQSMMSLAECLSLMTDEDGVLCAALQLLVRHSAPNMLYHCLHGTRVMRATVYLLLLCGERKINFTTCDPAPSSFLHMLSHLFGNWHFIM